MSKKKKRVVNYINNKALYEHMIEYRASVLKAIDDGKPRPPPTKYIAECAMKIVDGLASKKNFKNYSFIEEMKGDALENVMMYIHNFDPEKSKLPFAYITRIVEFAFIRRINTERHQQYITHKSAMNHVLADQLSPNLILGGNHELYDNLQEFISDYEAKRNLNRDKKKVQRKRTVKTSEVIWL